jgi:hypothetical protein
LGGHQGFKTFAKDGGNSGHSLRARPLGFIDIAAIAMPSNHPMPRIHPSADVQTKWIGEGTQIWQFVVVLPGAKGSRRGRRKAAIGAMRCALYSSG